MTRKDSIRSKDASKRWGSHEDLLNHSTQTKGNLRDLVTYQEDYIQQLEEEMGFCRNHLAETIDKVRHATLTQEKETQGKNKSIIGLVLTALRTSGYTKVASICFPFWCVQGSLANHNTVHCCVLCST